MELLTWTAHPARRRPRDLALLGAVLCLTAAAVLVAFQSLFFMVLALAIVLVSVAPFLFPTRYALSDWGVEERRLGRNRKRPWSELRRVQVGPGAALLSPFRQPSWMDRYRGMMLYFDGADRERVVALLQDRIDGR